MKILVVDDELSLAENVAEILAGAGHQADVATSAEEALVHLRIGPDGADLLVTDYRLPGATGADLIRSIRSLGNRIPALVITAYADDEIAESAMSAGAEHILGKPVDFERLLSWVAAAGSRKRPLDARKRGA
jgi:DNA-binding NtrC family response regulator